MTWGNVNIPGAPVQQAGMANKVGVDALGRPNENTIQWDESKRKPAKITFVGIAKNEEESIPRLVKSLEGFADRIVIVETKNSTDNTVQVAKDHGCEVLHIDWPKPSNYGEARNMAIAHAMSKCLTKKQQGDWIAMFDVDEILHNGPKLRAALEQTPESVHIASLQHKTSAGHNFPRAQIWRPGTCKFHYRVHEHLLRNDGNAGVLHIPEAIAYLEHPDAIGATHDHNELLESMRLDAEKFTDNATRQYYYARQLFYKKDLACLPIFDKVAEIGGWPEESCLGLCFAGQLLAENDRKEEAFEYFKKAINISDKVRDPFWGLLSMMPPDSKDAYELCKKALEIKQSIYFDSNPHLYNDENTAKLQKVIQQHEQKMTDPLGRPMQPKRETVPAIGGNSIYVPAGWGAGGQY